MKQIFFSVIAGSFLLLTGCVTVSQYRFSLHSDTGEVRREYYDLTSRQGANEQDYSVTNDWATLKKLVADREPEFDPEVVEDVSKALFEEKNVLCARKVQRIKCPRCFPNKAALLSFIHDKEWRFEMINEEVVLFLPSGKRVVSSNGQTVTTPRNSLIFWPQATTHFAYVVSEQYSGGTSLLSCYLEEQEKK